jgi:hypothetical protein
MTRIICEKCGREITVTQRAAARQRFCPECAKINHIEVVKSYYHRKKNAPPNARLCSCGCGRPVGEGLRFLSEYCYKNKKNDHEEEHSIRIGR